jgi:acyl carrier protein
MDRPAAQALLARVLLENFEVPGDKVTPKATFRGTLGLDSLDAIDLIFFVEKAFGFKNERALYRGLATVEQLLDFIMTQQRPEHA